MCTRKEDGEKKKVRFNVRSCMGVFYAPFVSTLTFSKKYFLKCYLIFNCFDSNLNMN